MEVEGPRSCNGMRILCIPRNLVVGGKHSLRSTPRRSQAQGAFSSANFEAVVKYQHSQRLAGTFVVLRIVILA